MSVTVGNVTVIVTDYQPKTDVRSSDSHISSDASDTNSSTAPHDLNLDSPAADASTNWALLPTLRMHHKQNQASAGC